MLTLSNYRKSVYLSRRRRRQRSTEIGRSLGATLCHLCLVAAHHFYEVLVLGCSQDDLNVELCLAISVLLQSLEELLRRALALRDQFLNVRLKQGLVLVEHRRVPDVFTH